MDQLKRKENYDMKQTKRKEKIIVTTKLMIKGPSQIRWKINISSWAGVQSEANDDKKKIIIMTRESERIYKSYLSLAQGQ